MRKKVETLQPQANKKVKNATKTIYNDIKFDSKLEVFAYQALDQAGIISEYNNNIVTLIPAFEYLNKKVRPITYKPDFVGKGWIMEIKGFESKDFPLRWKLLKYRLSMNDSHVKLFLVHNQKEVKMAIAEILQDERLL
jgi:hypothetical protein